MRVTNTVAFAGGLLSGALVTFLTAQLILGRLGGRPVLFGLVEVVGAVWIVGWWRSGFRWRVSLRQRQVARTTAESRPVLGRVVFGFLLGLGWWTLVFSPVYWIAVATAGLANAGLAGGVAFAVGRALPAIFGGILGDNVVSLLDRSLARVMRSMRVVSLAAVPYLLIVLADLFVTGAHGLN
jgi:cytochrome c biogenesis protein CcdA